MDEINQTLKKVGIGKTIVREGNKGFFQFNERRFIHNISIEFDEGSANCICVKWIAKGLVTNNLDFVTSNKYFHELWKKTNRQDYIECYKAEIDCGNNKRIIQYLGVSDERFIMLEAFDKNVVPL